MHYLNDSMFRKPFIKCPFCSEVQFGVAIVNGNRYFRRCNNCFRPTGHEKSYEYTLPPVSKKIIYLDQFAVSNMMKSVKKRKESGTSAADGDYFLELYKKLDRLTSAQLILCPSSQAHSSESVLSKKFEEFKRMYDNLSYGKSFYAFETIERFQISKLLRSWNDGKENVEWDFNPEKIMHSTINEWEDSIFITASEHYMVMFKPSILERRDNITERLAVVAHRWSGEKGRSFDQWFREEGLAYGPAILKQYFEHISSMQRIKVGKSPLSIENLLGSPQTDIVVETYTYLCKNYTSKEALQKTFEFFDSDVLLDIPFNEIASLIWAAVARKISAGQKRMPDGAMDQDIETISNLLPYCDALLIDRECHALLSEEPVRTRLEKYNTRVFSASNIREFMDFLDGIEKGASEEHLKAVEEVYGTDWRDPYLTMYDK